MLDIIKKLQGLNYSLEIENLDKAYEALSRLPKEHQNPLEVCKKLSNFHFQKMEVRQTSIKNIFRIELSIWNMDTDEDESFHLYIDENLTVLD